MASGGSEGKRERGGGGGTRLPLGQWVWQSKGREGAGTIPRWMGGKG